jgi:hypothetical protein
VTDERDPIEDEQPPHADEVREGMSDEDRPAEPELDPPWGDQ